MTVTLSNYDIVKNNQPKNNGLLQYSMAQEKGFLHKKLETNTIKRLNQLF